MQIISFSHNKWYFNYWEKSQTVENVIDAWIYVLISTCLYTQPFTIWKTKMVGIPITHSSCISSFWVIFKHPRESKVRNFTHQVTVDQDVPSSKVPVDIAHIWKVLHTWCYPTKHSHQLDDCELGIMFLKCICSTG